MPMEITVLVDVSRVVQVMEKCLDVILQTMFGFLLGSIHIFMNFACDDNNKVTNEIYMVTLFGS
jgi:hypothetical protein